MSCCWSRSSSWLSGGASSSASESSAPGCLRPGHANGPTIRRTWSNPSRTPICWVAWCEGEVVELVSITPGMVGQYLVALGGSPSKRNQHLAALLGFFDRLVQRHVVMLNPAASVSVVKEQVIVGKTPEITLEQTRKLLASNKVLRTVKNKQGEVVEEAPLVVGLRDRAILSTMRFTACRAGAVAKLTKKLTGKPLTTERICELVKRRLKDAGLPKQLSPHSFRVAAITDLLTKGEKLED